MYLLSIKHFDKKRFCSDIDIPYLDNDSNRLYLNK